jgi:signal transduction histidine kinase
MPQYAILCVDDERMVLDSLKEQLMRHLDNDCYVETAESGEEALKLFEELQTDGISIPLVITDQIMPGLQGDELLIKIHQTYPETLAILLTGQAHLNAVVNALNHANLYRYIGKPWEQTDLKLTITEALRRYRQDKKLYKQNEKLKQLYKTAQEEIQARKAAQHALAEMNSQLDTRVKERTAELDAFARTVAHDLKSPMGAISISAELLLETFHEYAAQPTSKLNIGQIISLSEAIYRSASKSTEIIESLLLLSQVRASDVKIHPLNMAHLTAEALESVSFMINEHQAHINLPESWPMAYGYGPWVETVWVNYLTNALKYGGPTPQISLGGHNKNQDFACFWVEDNGSGIPVEAQKNLFVEFTRLNHTRSSGHGLGLAIVRRIIEKLGGQVGVESGLNQGSRFYFTLPTQANFNQN